MKTLSGGNHPNAKAIITPAGRFESISDAVTYFELSDNAIRNRCKNHNFPDWHYESEMEDVSL